MVNANIPDVQLFPRRDWAQLLAYAWTEPSYPEVLTDLRKDPKGTVIELAEGSGSRYPNVDNDTQQAARSIQEQAESSPGENYSGYLPIPAPLGGLEGLAPKALEVLIRNGITGILQFDRQAEIWADVLRLVWNDQTLLSNVRIDPLAHLPHKEALLRDKYGIFPLPDRPRGLSELQIEKLGSFLSDEDNVAHLTGIFLIAS